MENLGLFLLVLIAIVLIVDPILEKYGTMDVINNEKVDTNNPRYYWISLNI